MPTNLPIDLLRTMVAIADTGSMVRATERIFRTQSALSLQMKRLEELVQTPLFRREGRHLTLTPAGELLLDHAREILRINDRAIATMIDDALTGPARIGLVQDFAESLLSTVLARFARLNPEAEVHVRVSNSHELNEMLRNDRLDVVLCLAALDDPAAIAVADINWIGDPALIGEPVIPLALLDSPCMCRDAGLEAIKRAGLDYRIIVETPNLSVLMGAVKAGLAITCRPRSYLGWGIEPLDLPQLQLPQIAYALHTRTPPPRSIGRLTQVLKAAVQEL